MDKDKRLAAIELLLAYLLADRLSGVDARFPGDPSQLTDEELNGHVERILARARALKIDRNRHTEGLGAWDGHSFPSFTD